MTEVKKQKDGGGGRGGSDESPSAGGEWEWRYGSFLPGERTATPMSEGGGDASKLTKPPFAGRMVGGGTRVRIPTATFFHSSAEVGIC